MPRRLRHSTQVQLLLQPQVRMLQLLVDGLQRLVGLDVALGTVNNMYERTICIMDIAIVVLFGRKSIWTLCRFHLLVQCSYTSDYIVTIWITHDKDLFHPSRTTRPLGTTQPRAYSR